MNEPILLTQNNPISHSFSNKKEPKQAVQNQFPKTNQNMNNADAFIKELGIYVDKQKKGNFFSNNLWSSAAIYPVAACLVMNCG